ncbi:hypothetical protein ABIA39_000219 [Nocardia sp. GAS34]|uniref:hypothetical protein n=1 Tax=unclassified Nocardia TaxID=2637762 RepID=UPI003D24016D
MRKTVWAVLLIGALSGCGSMNHGDAGIPVRPVPASSAGPTTSKCPAPAPAAATGYTATTTRIRSKTAIFAYNITLPQLTGGTAAVRDRFNSAMHAALSDATAVGTGTVADGEIPYDCNEASGVTRIGAHVIAGVLITNRYSGGAYPSNQLDTVVIDTATAQPILLPSVLRNPARAWETLAALAPTLVPAGEPKLDTPEATGDSFAEWLPSPAGLTVYFGVPHVLGDYHPVLFPWSRIRDLFTPSELAILSS